MVFRQNNNRFACDLLNKIGTETFYFDLINRTIFQSLYLFRMWNIELKILSYILLRSWYLLGSISCFCGFYSFKRSIPFFVTPLLFNTFTLFFFGGLQEVSSKYLFINDDARINSAALGFRIFWFWQETALFVDDKDVSCIGWGSGGGGIGTEYNDVDWE